LLLGDGASCQRMSFFILLKNWDYKSFYEQDMIWKQEWTEIKSLLPLPERSKKWYKILYWNLLSKRIVVFFSEKIVKKFKSCVNLIPDYFFHSCNLSHKMKQLLKRVLKAKANFQSFYLKFFSEMALVTFFSQRMSSFYERFL
jgi:hypothetical protein